MADNYDDYGVFDEDDIYKGDCPDLDILNADEPMQFALNTDPNAAPVRNQGTTKGHYSPVEGQPPLFDGGHRTDYHVSVLRLIWADGWQQTTIVNGQKVPKQHMTLVVLKFVIQPKGDAVKVESVSATLTFKDVDKDRGNDPRVQAWAPFHDMERANATVSHIKSTTKKDASINVGYQDASVSGGISKEREISWERTEFDEGRSNVEYSQKGPSKGRGNGVTWFVRQNRLENQGVNPAFWTAVLISRDSPDPYLVNFRIRVRAGTAANLKDNIKEFFRLPPGDTSTFTATPRTGEIDERNCHGEGLDIMESKAVDLNNLGKLRDPKNRTMLVVSWIPPPFSPLPPVPEAKDSEEKKAPMQIGITIENRESVPQMALKSFVVPTVEPTAERLAKRSDSIFSQPVDHAVEPALKSIVEPTARSAIEPTLDPQVEPTVWRSVPNNAQGFAEVTGSNISADHTLLPPVASQMEHESDGQLPGVDSHQAVNDNPSRLLPRGGESTSAGFANDSSRLVSLETRAAITEARLAAQDVLILQLQRALDQRDAQLARLEQAIRAAATALSQLPSGLQQ